MPPSSDSDGSGARHRAAGDLPAARSSRGLVGIVVALLAAAGAWLLAGPQERSMEGLSTGPLPYLPDAWSSVFYEVYLAIGAPLDLSPYYFWGKFAFLFYVAGFVASRALPTGPSRRSRIGRRLLLVGWLVGLVGDVLGYWSGRGDELTTLTSLGFGLLELPAMLLLLVSSVVYGLGLLHDVVPRGVGWCLLGGVAGVVLSSILYIRYLPHGVLLPLLLGTAAALVAARLSSRRSVVPQAA